MMPQATQTIPRRPLIGVTGGLNEKGFLNIRNGYMQSVVRAGGIPVLLPLDAPEEILRDAFERMDGVLISGGADIDPALYGEETLPECGALDPARDRQEMLMAKWSRSAGKPALGICRGCQVMNVAAGGTLVQDIASTYHISKDVHSQPEDYALRLIGWIWSPGHSPLTSWAVRRFASTAATISA